MKTEIINNPFLGVDGKYHYLYKIVNNVNGKYYYGVHSTKDLKNDKYKGSGKTLKKAIAKYDAVNFTKTILSFFQTENEMFDAESKIITENELNDENCYNISSGGLGGRNGMVVVFDNDGNKIVVTKEYAKAMNLVSINLGEGNPSYKKKRTPEVRKRISESIKNFYKTHKYRNHTEEEKEKQSKQIKGRFCLTKDDIRKVVKLNEACELINNGWELKPGHKYYINNGENTLLVNRFEHETIYKDWTKGKLKPTKKKIEKIKKETYKEIAERTGFCVETVSKYMKKYGYIDKDLVEKVRKENIRYYGKRYYYNNEYLTLTQLSKKYNMDYRTIKNKINLGWSIDEIIEKRNIKNIKRKSKLYEYEGKLYSISELSKNFNVSETMLRQRLSKGMNVKDSVLIKNKRLEPKKYIYCGKEYSMLEISKTFGIPLSTVKQRIRNGWEINEVIEGRNKKK